MNVSLPDELKSFVDERIDRGGYGSTSEYARDLIRRDQDRERLRGVLVDGATSAAQSPTTATSSASGIASLPPADRPVATRGFLRQLAATDLESAREFYRQKGGEQPALGFIDVAERASAESAATRRSAR